MKKGRANGAFCFAAALAQMLLLAIGLCWAVTGGLALPAAKWLLYGGIAGLCVIFTVFFYGSWLTGARIYGAVALVLVAAAVVLFQQKAFLSGFRQLGCAVLERMNESYGGDYMLPAVEENGRDISVFLLLCFIPVTAYLGAFVVYSTDTLMTGLLVFPLMALLLLAGAAPSSGAFVCVLLGSVSLLASARVGERKSLWGKRDSWQWKENRQRRQRISAASAVLVCALCGLLAIPSFVVLMPSLAATIGQTEGFAVEVKGRFAQTLLSILPDSNISGLSSPVTVSGGGVEDGSLSNSDGYLISGVEDLRLKCSRQPDETIYLRGFIGGTYSDSQWLEFDGKAFSAAAAGWSTEGDPGIYLYNLPFLRMLYEEQTVGLEYAAAELTVERINANDSYTYTPYGSYLNDYYVVRGGDGAVAGQSVQDDIYTFYSRAAQMATLEEEYFLQNETVLDRLERSYASFAKENYTALPEGFAQLQEQCDAAGVDGEDLDQIIAYVQEYLAQNYTYSLTFPEVPAGEDAVLYFLYESKTGCSPHFASAAAMIFRALGVPARYVVGYAASQSQLTAQPDGSYQAVLQSDDAHAWVEIYISGVGWMPVETTPGQFGMVQDTPYYGDDLNPETTGATEPTLQDQETEPAPEQEQAKKTGHAWAILAALVLAGAFVAAVVFWQRRRRRDLGLNRAVEPAKRVRFIFAAYYRRLIWAGMPQEVESTSAQFPQWVARIDPVLGEDLERMMALVLESCFGQKQIRERDVTWMRSLYRAARSRIRRLKKEKL